MEPTLFDILAYRAGLLIKAQREWESYINALV